MHPSIPFTLSPRLWAILALVLGLSACDMLGIESPAQEAARKTAEGKAIGSACRHAVRSIEDCYKNNPKAGKAAVFDGWREMDEYMRENKIEGMPAEKSAPASAHEPVPAVAEKEEIVPPKESKDVKPSLGKVDLPPRPGSRP